MSMPEINQFSFDEHPELLTQLEEFKKTKQQEQQSTAKAPEPLPPVDNTGTMQLVEFQEEKLDDGAKTNFKEDADIDRVFAKWFPDRYVTGNTNTPVSHLVRCINTAVHDDEDPSMDLGHICSDGGRNRFFCRACDWKGDIVDLAAVYFDEMPAGYNIATYDPNIISSVVMKASRDIFPHMDNDDNWREQSPGNWIYDPTQTLDNHELSVKEINELAEVNDPDIQSRSDEYKLKYNLFQDLEDDFWTAREFHRKIFQQAMAKQVAPWALFGATMCRICSTIPYTVRIPGISGSDASLNFFVALVGTPGDGKDTSADISADFINDPETVEIGECSPQGFAKAFVTKDPRNPKVQTWVTRSVFSRINEINSIQPDSKNKSMSITPYFRKSWSGQLLSFQYATAEKQVKIPRHSYRHSFLVGVQPSESGWLFGEAGGGTPQRFTWFGGLDKRIRANNLPPEIKSLDYFVNWSKIANTTEYITYPDSVVDEIRNRAAEKNDLENRNEEDFNPLDSHIGLMKLKVAALLAVMDCRKDVNEDDWRLAEIVIRVSRFHRTRTLFLLDEHIKNEAERKGKELGATKYASDEAHHDSATSKCEKRILDVLKANNNELGKGKLKQKINTSQRRVFDEVLVNMVNNNLIKVESYKDSTGRTAEKVVVI